MDVGVDVAYDLFGAYRPFSEMEIYDRLAARKGHDDLQFYKDFQEQRKNDHDGKGEES